MRTRVKETFEKVRQEAINLTGIDIVYATLRKTDYVRLRCAIINVMSKYAQARSTELAEIFDYADHTPVLHHQREHLQWYRRDDEYRYLYDTLAKFVQSIPEYHDLEVELKELSYLIREAFTF